MTTSELSPSGGAHKGRRKFLNWLLGTSAGATFAWVLFPIFQFLSPPDVPEATTNQVDAGPTNDPELLDRGFKIIRFGAEPVILLRLSETEFRAFGATCTHLDCIVEYRKDLQVLWCNCHNGQYDLTGRNVAGPPPRPLPPYTVHTVPVSGGPAKLVVERT